jgi:hypothetical protein
VVAALIAAGATIDPARKDRRTPLIIAAGCGHAAAAEALLAAGADVNMVCDIGAPLGVAQQHAPPSSRAALERLQKGAGGVSSMQPMQPQGKTEALVGCVKVSEGPIKEAFSPVTHAFFKTTQDDSCRLQADLD